MSTNDAGTDGQATDDGEAALRRRVDELEARMDAMSNWVETLEDKLAEERASEERAADERTQEAQKARKHPRDYN